MGIKSNHSNKNRHLICFGANMGTWMKIGIFSLSIIADMTKHCGIPKNQSSDPVKQCEKRTGKNTSILGYIHCYQTNPKKDLR